jgi:hypothetical protein
MSSNHRYADVIGIWRQNWAQSFQATTSRANVAKIGVMLHLWPTKYGTCHWCLVRI